MSTRRPTKISLWPSFAQFHVAGLFFLLSLGHAPAAPTAANPVVVLTVENRLEILPAGARRWHRGQTNEMLDPGDQGRTFANSRATLRMSDSSVVRLNENTFFEILAPATAQESVGVTLGRGALYFFHRGAPVDVKVKTPAASAAIRGTEFVLQHDELLGRTTLTLLDGAVALSALDGRSLELASREQGVVETGKAPVRTAVIDTANILQWCLYYPAVLDLRELDLSAEEMQALSASLAAWRAGDLLQALAAYPEGRAPVSDAEKIYYASLLLGVGQIANAEAVLDSLALRSASARGNDALAAALRRLVAAVSGTTSAPSPSAQLASTLLAESYFQQSRVRSDRQSHLDEALAAARRAVEISPEFAFGWARVAELEFGFGRIRAASAALDRSLQLAPRNAQAVALKGYLAAARNRIPEAIKSFDDAIGLDGALGNAWLGRGLCRIRQGQSGAGRADLQTAAVLEPQRSLFRSYLGKAYGDHGDFSRATNELRLAVELDPRDPTPWLYSAMLHRDNNWINPAVADLEHSVELNDHRSLFRSEFLLDQDRAVRSSGLAYLYESAGMDEVSAREAARAVSYDYANASSHLFLSESYNALRDPTRFNLRYETPWFNELLLANLLAPVGGTPLSQNISQSEYTRLFEQDHLGLASETGYRSDGQVWERASQFGVLHNTGYSLDVDYQHNDGVRPNNELDRLEWYTTIKQQLTPQDSVLMLTKYQNYHSGDNFQYYDPTNARPNFQFDEHQPLVILGGYHREWSPGSHTLLLAGHLENDQQFSDMNVPELVVFKDAVGQPVALGSVGFDANHSSAFDAWTAELQHLLQSARQTLVVGGRIQSGEFETHSVLSNPSSASGLFQMPPADISATEGFERASVYAYYTLSLVPGMRLTAGGAYDYLKFPQNFRFPPITAGEETRDQWSPKLALVWNPIAPATVRGVYTRSLGGVTLDESYRLEPTQLAGFSQAFRTLIPESVVGSVSAPQFETWGAALDLKLKTRTYLGVQAEWLRSTVDQSVGVFDYNNFTTPILPSSTPQNLDYHENDVVVTLNQLLSDEWAFGAQYRYSHADLQSVFPQIPSYLQLNGRSLDSHDQADLQSAGVNVLYNHPAGFFSRAEATWYWQHNESTTMMLPGDSFGQINFYVGWRLRHQRAELTLGVLNLTDRDYHLNPLNVYAELPRERVFMARLRFRF